MTIKYRSLITTFGLLLCSITGSAQKGSAFKDGVARVENNGHSWYINAAGEKMFDTIFGTYHPAIRLSDAEIDIKEDQKMMLVSTQDKMGVVNDSGRWLLQPVYDSIEFRWKSHLYLRQHGKATYADSWGKLLLPLEFEEVELLKDDYFMVKSNNKWGVYNIREKRLLVPAVYENIDYCGGCGAKGDYVFAQKDGKWGVVSFENKELVPFTYEHEHFAMRSDNWVRCFKKNDQPVVINIATRKEYAEPEYTQMDVIGNGMLKLKHNGHFGLVNEKGSQVADYIYDDINDPYAEGTYGPYLSVTQHKKTGIIGEDGKVIIPLSYDGEIGGFANCFIVPVNGKYILVDSAGKKLLDREYNNISGVSAGRETDAAPVFILKQQALYGFYNPVNKKTVAPAFFGISVHDSGGLLEMEYQGRKGLYNVEGEQLLPVAYREYAALTPSLYMVRDGRLKGVYDIRAKRLVLPMVFEEADLLAGDSSLIRVTKKTPEGSYVYGVYNGKGEVIVPVKYGGISLIGKGTYLVSDEKKNATTYALFNARTGKLAPLPYSYLGMPGVEGQVVVEKNNKAGVINEKGEAAIPCIYERVKALPHGIYQLVKGEKYGYADSTGKEIVPLIYDYDVSGDISYDLNDVLLLTKTDPQEQILKIGLASLEGVILTPPVHDRVLPEVSGHGYLVMNNSKFSVLSPAGKPISPLKFDDILLGERAGFGVVGIKYNFPLLCRIGNTCQYLTADGGLLPLKMSETIPFEEEGTWGAPEL